MKHVGLNIILALAAIFAPAAGMLGTAFALVMFDLVSGILASRKQNIPITSSGLQRTVVKCLVYEISIALAFITEVYLFNHSMPVSNIVAGLIGVTELKSCFENIDIIGGGDLLKQVINKLGSKN